MSEQVTQINISKDTKNIVIFVHGFGVRYDSRGMFTDIKNSLLKEWGSVLFDLNTVEEKTVTIQSIDSQIAHLRTIHKSIIEKYPLAAVHIIAHSQGCVITAFSGVQTNGRVVLLAPPESMGIKTEEYFKNQPAVKVTQKYFIVPRKDGSTTQIPLNYFRSDGLQNAEENIVKYSETQNLYVLQATEDEVLGATEYAKLRASRSIKVAQIGSDHNFTGENRLKLINYTKDILET